MNNNYTQKMKAEMELMQALQEWLNAGAPVVDVVQALDVLIDEKLRLLNAENAGLQLEVEALTEVLHQEGIEVDLTPLQEKVND